MNNDLTFGVHGTFDPNITFLTTASKEVMRIDNNGVTVNPDLPVDEAAQHVINALDEHIKSLIQAEREACAKVFDDINAKYKWPDNVAERVASQWCADAIRARGNT